MTTVHHRASLSTEVLKGFYEITGGGISQPVEEDVTHPTCVQTSSKNLRLTQVWTVKRRKHQLHVKR